MFADNAIALPGSNFRLSHHGKFFVPVMTLWQKTDKSL